jgi:DNA modification methylase
MSTASTRDWAIMQGDVIRHCTALELLRGLPDASVDLIATDPPYGIGYTSTRWSMNNNRDPRKTSMSFGEDVFQDNWIADAERILKPGGALYLFTRWDVLHLWKAALEAAGLVVVQRIIWDKLHWGVGNLKYYGSQTEDILFCVKGDHRLRWSKRQGNMWRLTKLDVINHEGNEDNPTQKPERLIRRIIELSSDPGDLVVDPFMGSGTTGAAARALGRRYLMCDRSEAQYRIAVERLSRPFAVSMFAGVIA